MPDAPPELQCAREAAARAAAARVYKIALQMLADNERGEIAVIVGYGSLQPEKRKHERAPLIKVGRGRMTALERVE